MVAFMRGTEFSEYEAFVAVVTTGSFVGGAHAVGVSASAMSQIIRRLERRLGVQLIRRTTRSISLTDAGERFFTRLRAAFSEFDAAASELDERRKTPAGTVRVIVPRVAYTDVIEPLLPAFHRSYPDVMLDIRIDERIANIVSDGYDVGVRLGEYLAKDTVAFPVGPRLRQIAVASPEYVARHGCPEHPHDLIHHTCINWRQSAQGPVYDWEFEKDGSRVTVSVRGPLILSDRDMAVRAARNGIGIALWVEHRLRPLIEAVELVPMLEDWSPGYPGFHAYYYRDQHMSPATRAFLDMLRKSSGAGR
jgi:DNA-binding transcriptional LysR family regulator